MLNFRQIICLERTFGFHKLTVPAFAHRIQCNLPAIQFASWQTYSDYNALDVHCQIGGRRL